MKYEFCVCFERKFDVQFQVQKLIFHLLIFFEIIGPKNETLTYNRIGIAMDWRQDNVVENLLHCEKFNFNENDTK